MLHAVYLSFVLMKKALRILIGVQSLFMLSHGALGLTINADFCRDVVNGTNPGTNPAPVLYAGTGPAADTGTLWNDLQISLAATGDSGANTIVHPVLFENLAASDGSSTTVDIQLTSGFSASFNSAAALSSNVASLQNDRVFSAGGNKATMKIQSLNPAKKYDIILIGSAAFSTAFTVNSVVKVATGNSYDGAWTAGGEYVSFAAVSPTAGGEIQIDIQDGATPIDSFGVISGLQIVERTSQFFYAGGVASTGGQFSSSYPPTNLMNNGFTSPADLINTTVDYAAAGKSYATVSGTVKNFNLTFEFPNPSMVDGMHVWNYVYRSGATGGSTSPLAGVNSYTLTFYDGPAATGAAIGTVFSGALNKAVFDAQNAAQSIYFDAPYQNVRSVVMRVLSNHGSTGFTGMNEVAFNGAASGSSSILSFASSAPFAQRPAKPTLSWSLGGSVTSLSISPGIGDVLPLTNAGSGSIEVSPLGEQTYTLTLNGSITKTVSVVGLPAKEKLHLYLFIGQSNMQGAGSPYSEALDSPVPRVVKFGSRSKMESIFVKGGHSLTALETTTNSAVGMGIEFGKTILAAQTDPEVVIGIINHALGSTAIQWWAPGAKHTKEVNPVTGADYYLYDEAVQRVRAASNYGVLKGVLWHQGEYNSGTNTNPDSDPANYGVRLQALVTNLRNSFGNPGLPFVCGKFVPATWTYANGTPGAFTGLPSREIVEDALASLPNNKSNTFCVNNDGLRGRSDQLIHFDAYSQRLLGQRYAAAINSFHADPFRFYLGGFLTPTQLSDPLLTHPQGDNDGDELSNFLEFAFLTDPSKPQAITPFRQTTVEVAGEGTFPAISFRQRFDTEAPQYIVEVSRDLSTWQSNSGGSASATVAVGNPVDNFDGTSTSTVRHVLPLSSGGQPLFFRIRVTGP